MLKLSKETDGYIKTYSRFRYFLFPWEYTNWIDECMSWKEACYLGDWSILYKAFLRGPDALKFLSYASVNGYHNFEIGQAKHCIMCNKNGKVVAEGIVMKFAEDEYMLSGGPIPYGLII
ncbi:hypothetical protein ACFLYL_00675 [Chloroflexota bacterium]